MRTIFASPGLRRGLTFRWGMAELSDGSVLVSVSNGTFFGASSGALLRLVDTNGDGVSDAQQSVVANAPNGSLSSVRVLNDLVFATGQGKAITVYRMGDDLAAPYSLLGRIDINYNQQWLHPHSTLAVRQGNDAQQYELYFQLGSKTNWDDTVNRLSFTSTLGVNGQLNGDSIYRITLNDDGDAISAGDVTQIATGLRNAAGMVFAPHTGDLYLQDNGIDGVAVPIEPTSADELNFVRRENVGGPIEDFGFPENYTEYRTDRVVGGQGIQPLFAFQPLDGAEAEGPQRYCLFTPLFSGRIAQWSVCWDARPIQSGGSAKRREPTSVR